MFICYSANQQNVEQHLSIHLSFLSSIKIWRYWCFCNGMQNMKLFSFYKGKELNLSSFKNVECSINFIFKKLNNCCGSAPTKPFPTYPPCPPKNNKNLLTHINMLSLDLSCDNRVNHKYQITIVIESLTPSSSPTKKPYPRSI